MPIADPLEEARRQLTICNACRYCEGYCAVFPSLELRTEIARKDALHLANLCHDCRGCYYACMYTPPHEFAMNIPQILSLVRAGTYRDYGRPAGVSRILGGGVRGPAIAATVGILAAVVVAFAFRAPGEFLAARAGPGSFYRIVPYAVMAGAFLGLTAFVAGVALDAVASYWRDTHGRLSALLDARAHAGALRDALSLRYLNDTADGCYYPGERPGRQRSVFHHLVFYGFLADLISTTIAAFLHNIVGVESPYPVVSAPVLFGIGGGIAQIAGTIGLLWLKWRSDARPAAAKMASRDYAFLAMLNLVSVTGMLVLMLRETSALGPVLVVHLGTVAGLFLTMPYGKFVHFLYRYAALVQNRIELAREGGR
ncbi:MAG TPA: tricarballylate utilization 4Fe-4S protein TcuB [Candidatus Limnocylindria bacterium]|jgi:citrate/tricarballylate utilization protein